MLLLAHPDHSNGAGRAERSCRSPLASEHASLPQAPFGPQLPLPLNGGAPRMAEEKERSDYSDEACEFIGDHVKEHREKGMPQDQAVAAAMSEARRKGLKVPEEE